MSSSGSARRTTRRSPRVLAAATAVAVLLVVVAATAAVLGHQSPATPTRPALAAAAGSPPDVLGREDRAPVGEADGVLPAGATVSDDDLPGVANLDPALLGALRRATADAGIEFRVTSGWRSAEYQDQLLREAVSEYGSEEEAARWVATAETSAHVSGDAVDIGPSDAMGWLSENGAEHGLCQVYANEPWHYELRPEAIDHRCPRMYADPTQDPRMRQ